MAPLRMFNNLATLYTNELGSRAVAESGIPTDQYHLGKIILQCFKDAPDFIAQIDGVTDEYETNNSLLERSVRCAISLRKLGLKAGDVMVLMAPNHLDLAVPFYAALYNGIAIAAVNPGFDQKELKLTLNVNKPKVVFCQSEKAPDVQNSINELKLECKIVTFDEQNKIYINFKKLLEQPDDREIKNFKPADFNTEDTIALLIATSGTTGHPKSSVLTHKNFFITTPAVWSKHTKFPTPTRMALVASNLLWVTAQMHFVGTPIMRITRLQSSLTVDTKILCKLINKYKPTFAILSSPVIYNLIMSLDENMNCKLSSFESLYSGGAPLPKQIEEKIKKISPETDVCQNYGMSEIGGVGLINFDGQPGSCGSPMAHLLYRLTDVDTQQDIDEPHVTGELWVKGPGLFKEYYNDPVSTAEAFADDGWFRTGDLFYRDENYHLYFVDRLKLLLKYKLIKISPIEIETVVRKHPNVRDVIVVGIPNPEVGDIPTACVISKDNSSEFAAEIIDLVKDSLSDAKQLRGGVIFMNDFPTTATSKIDRRKLKSIAEKIVNKGDNRQ